MSDLLPLLGEKRKSNFGAVKTAFDPVRTSAEKYLSLTVAPPSND
jgi:hypothetical protein